MGPSRQREALGFVRTYVTFTPVTYLALSIALSACIFLMFQLFPRWKVETFTAIVINYGVAAALGWGLAGGIQTYTEVATTPWTIIALVMGFLFIYLFQLIARSTQENGVTVTSIAAKLSMVIPVALFLMFDPTDALDLRKGLAISLSIPAIILASWKPNNPQKIANWRMPLVIFIGSGLIDLMFAAFSGDAHMVRVEHRFLFAALPLITAFLAGAGWKVVKVRKSKTTLLPNPATIWAGVSLGIINFGSLYCLLETYDKTGIDRSAVMPVNNLGVILLSAGLSVALLQERLASRNVAGLILGAIAIALLLWEALVP